MISTANVAGTEVYAAEKHPAAFAVSPGRYFTAEPESNLVPEANINQMNNY